MDPAGYPGTLLFANAYECPECNLCRARIIRSLRGTSCVPVILRSKDSQPDYSSPTKSRNCHIRRFLVVKAQPALTPVPAIILSTERAGSSNSKFAKDLVDLRGVSRDTTE